MGYTEKTLLDSRYANGFFVYLSTLPWVAILFNLVKGNNNKALAKIFILYTQCLVLYVLHAKIKNRKILLIGKIRCVMRLTRKSRVKFEVTEVSDHVVL